MVNFTIHFLICNIFVSIIIGLLLSAKRLLKNSLTNRAQYNLWFLMLVLLLMPFIPFPFGKQTLSRFLNQLIVIKKISAFGPETMIERTSALSPSNAFNWMNDFSVSAGRRAPSGISLVLWIIWLAGILIMTGLMAKSMLRFFALKRSALPLQNPIVHRLYLDCLDEMRITKHIPVYCTAFLKSPILAGLIKPRIYLPLHLISDYDEKEIRFILLHELQHYKYKDDLGNYLMGLIHILYWFNPFVWYALKEMRCDREIACDTSVLEMLDQDAYKDYGNVLINFAEKISLGPFATGISGSMKQMKRRIVNIAAYHPASFHKNLYSCLSWLFIAIFLLCTVPVLSLQAYDDSHYSFDEKDKKISYIDLSADFGEYKGSFVLYDAKEDAWRIYNKDYAATRISPVSTYKIYDALFALESGVITPSHSLLPWNGQKHRYDLWNTDQTLASAMQNSVTWYFQALDEQTGLPSIRNYIRKIGYGNQNVSGEISSYWIDSSLKISPIEQVEMLKKFYDNQFHFLPENIEAVKNSICLYSGNDSALYGKTGTEEVNGQNVSGWFIGYLEKDGHPYFFATNIQNETLSTGPIAAELTFSILSTLGI